MSPFHEYPSVPEFERAWNETRTRFFPSNAPTPFVGSNLWLNAPPLPQTTTGEASPGLVVSILRANKASKSNVEWFVLNSSYNMVFDVTNTPNGVRIAFKEVTSNEGVVKGRDDAESKNKAFNMIQFQMLAASIAHDRLTQQLAIERKGTAGKIEALEWQVARLEQEAHEPSSSDCDHEHSDFASPELCKATCGHTISDFPCAQAHDCTTPGMHHESRELCRLNCGHVHDDFAQGHCYKDDSECPLQDDLFNVRQESAAILVATTDPARARLHCFHDHSDFAGPELCGTCKLEHEIHVPEDLLVNHKCKADKTHLERVSTPKGQDSNGCKAADLQKQTVIDYQSERIEALEADNAILAKVRTAMLRPTFAKANWIERFRSNGKMKLASQTFHIPKSQSLQASIRGRLVKAEDAFFAGNWSEWVLTPNGLRRFYECQDSSNKVKLAKGLGLTEDELLLAIPSPESGVADVCHLSEYHRHVANKDSASQLEAAKLAYTGFIERMRQSGLIIPTNE